MRKELIGIFLFFLVILTLISLMSYSPADPSIHNAKAAGDIHNLFGLFGAHLSGILVGLFGLGAFWFPILLLLASIQFFGNHPDKAIVLTIVGGILLVVTTGSLLALKQNHIIIFGTKFSSGGIIGIPLKSFLVKYSNVTGGTIILVLFWLTGFILATGFSLIMLSKRCWKTIIFSADRIHTLIIKWKEQWKKSRKHSKIKKEQVDRKERKIKIKAPH